MSYEIQQSSPELQQEATTKPRKQQTHTPYPFAQLLEGQSFGVPRADANISSIRARCSQLSVNGKRYKAIVWDNVIEVGRLPDLTVEEQQPQQQGGYQIQQTDQFQGQQQQSQNQQPQPSNVGTRPEDYINLNAGWNV